ncbi:diguanylate cyclase (GGDEF) domain-containing protein [Quadrisphaera granulorum]|uniref:Diguanylate cyclase (GGDEF)-like protein n=1 Tax=Quadrisphaera granulorum TaxID=317664 RepID=A0A316A6A2_9ACTN|nr:GGDEF domain-containing protein [Quadrisphaera granulorum]PWJ52768.1 diguanylate cyclase (GGDEF)-like protein [Quadrisphaera granulorum]SZE97373.1 diguanylate cyclase (GGDEF) domain-containing protein [Quadrisphaera granulorum]
MLVPQRLVYAFSMTAPIVVTAAMAAAMALSADRLGAEVSWGIAVGLGAVMGFLALPPVRRWNENRSEGVGGLAGMLLAVVVLGAMLAALGMSALVPAAVASSGIHSVLLQPTRARIVQVHVVQVVASAAALGCQALGWVGGVLPVPAAALVAGTLLVVSSPIAAGVARDAVRANAALEKAARLDALTGLLGRRGLEEPLRRAAGSAAPHTPSGVIYLDLDGFKAVNDVHGHAAGDELLKAVARRLQQCVRDDDAIARTGGDEFVIVLFRLHDESEAELVAARVREAVARAVLLADGTEVTVGVSTGVATATTPCDVDQLVCTADAAMYVAKRASRLARGRAPSGVPQHAAVQLPTG